MSTDSPGLQFDTYDRDAELRADAKHRQDEVDILREQEALGAAVIDPAGNQAGELVTRLKPEDFLSPFHRQVFTAIVRMAGRGLVPFGYKGLIAELMTLGAFHTYDGAYTLVTALGEGIVLAVPMQRRCDQIQKGANRRRLQRRAQKVADGR